MPATRTTDPHTSHEAEISVVRVTQVQSAILQILSTMKMHDEQLLRFYEAAMDVDAVPFASQSGVRSRRAELVDLGLVEDSGERVKTRSGRQSIVWQVAQ
jgi:hypothetical protein